jgi:hypothetical protein
MSQARTSSGEQIEIEPGGSFTGSRGIRPG